MNPKSKEYKKVAKIVSEHGYLPKHPNSAKLLERIEKVDGDSDYGVAVLFAHTFVRIFHPERFPANNIPIFTAADRDTLISQMPTEILDAHINTARSLLNDLYNLLEITDMNEESLAFKKILFP